MIDMKPVIYLDMDGVLADFEGWALNNIGPMWKAEISKPGWGKFAEFTNLYSLLPILENAKELYEVCCDTTGDRNQVRILTALSNKAGSKFPTAAVDKINWARYNIHPDIRVVFGPYAQDKQYHCSLPEDILIDDMGINVSQWVGRGGTGILHTSTKLTSEALNNIKYSRND